MNDADIEKNARAIVDSFMDISNEPTECAILSIKALLKIIDDDKTAHQLIMMKLFIERMV